MVFIPSRTGTDPRAGSDVQGEKQRLGSDFDFAGKASSSSGLQRTTIGSPHLGRCDRVFANKFGVRRFYDRLSLFPSLPSPPVSRLVSCLVMFPLHRGRNSNTDTRDEIETSYELTGREVSMVGGIDCPAATSAGCQ